MIVFIEISFNRMQPCLKITNGSYNVLINLGFFAVVVVTLPMPDEHLITNPRLLINTLLFATVLERLMLFPIKTP